MRRNVTIAVLVLIAVALVVQRASAPLRRGAPAPDPSLAVVQVSDDATSVIGVARDGSPLFTYALGDWHEWAREHLEAELGPVRIGDQEVPPEAFDRFGVADLGPDGERVLVSVSAYAMLTTVSVVGVLDPRTLRFEAVDDPAFGGVDEGEIAWAPGGGHIAYALGTARARGDLLRVDDVREFRVVRTLAGEALLDTPTADDLEPEAEPEQWLPGFRDLEWLDAGALAFTTHDPAEGSADGAIRWRFEVDRDEVLLE